MGLNANGYTAAANGLAALVTHIGVHNNVPDTAGSNEVAGTTRAAVAWTNTGGVLDNTAQLVHALAAGDAVAFYGLWGALAAGTFYGYVPRAGTGQSRAGFGSVDAAGVVANAIQSAAHNLANDMTLIVYNVLGEALPAGLTEGTPYFVVGATTDTFQLSLTLAGAAVDITGQGELYFARYVTETFASPGNLVVAAGALDVPLTVI
jgi:hypothetical protein